MTSTMNAYSVVIVVKIVSEMKLTTDTIFSVKFHFNYRYGRL